ncbi:MAG TPA: 1-deoxy-D-xylulose-5-phosphate reductoisomerase, partial [Spirochaetota bacterium]|nr:1-deoxy-D-xylulose-5-phosphate reductoisomerase [Spirochaetota bacterium]
MRKNFSILGATGSIGDSALKVLENFKENLNLVAVSTNKNIKKLIQIIEKHSPEYAVITDKGSCQEHFNSDRATIKNTKIFSGIEYLLQLCSDKKNNIILNAVSGKSGLIPSLKCLENGIDLALANKESMVCAGPLLKKTARQNRCSILPVDSEHSAIFQLLRDKNSKDI